MVCLQGIYEEKNKFADEFCDRRKGKLSFAYLLGCLEI
jgi:hypothetical protein